VVPDTRLWCQTVNEVKVDEAKRLLESTELSITDISERLDYSSQNYFQTIFKDITGMTPRTYRAAPGTPP
jgi:AraC-like DNA-binding protein